LDGGNNRRGKTGGDGDDLIAGTDAPPGGKLGTGQRGEGDEIGGGPGVDQQGVLYAEEGREFLFKRLSFGAEREPKVEGGADRRFDFIFGENAAGVGDRGLAGNERRARGIVAGALDGVGEARVLAGETKDLGLELGQGLAHGKNLGRRIEIGA
jgi:hypothetical protein